MRALPCHTIELTKRLRDVNAVQNIKRHVPEFQAWRCQGRGNKTSTAPMKETIGNAGYEGSMAERRV